MPLRQEFTLAITANDDAYRPPSWKVDCFWSELGSRVMGIEDENNVTVTAVYTEAGEKVREDHWR